MPGVGIRLWNPPQRKAGAENPMTVVNTTVLASNLLNGKTIPFKSSTGNILVRIVGRANTAIRPLTITVKWGLKTMVQKAFFVEQGDGGTFAGIWTLAGEVPATANVVISCGPSDAGCAAIRVGEVEGSVIQVSAQAQQGNVITIAKGADDALLAAGGYADANADPLFSLTLDMQWFVKIPPNTVLPNRHNGLAAFFGLTYVRTPDDTYRIRTNSTMVNIAGASAALDLRLSEGTG